MRTTHCTDERLLAYLDGEIGPLGRWRTSRHLRACWQCRERLSGLEREAELLARAARAGQAARAGEGDLARQRFLMRVRAESSAAPSAGMGQWWRLPAGVAAGALVLAAGIGVWQHTVGLEARSEAPVKRAAEPVAKAAAAPAAAAKAIPVESPAAPPIVAQPPSRTYAAWQLAEAELEAIAVLRAHPSPGLAAYSFERNPETGLRIAGIAESDAQRSLLLNDLEAAVRATAWSASLTVPEDIPGSATPAAEAPSSPVRSRRAPAVPLLLEALSKRMDAGEANRRANEIATSAIGYSSAAWSAAWNVSRLARRFPDATLAQLSPRCRELLAGLITGELREMRAALAAERELLEFSAPAARPTHAAELLPAVELVERLTHSLMSSGDAPLADARASMDELVSLLGGLEDEIESGEAAARLWPSLPAATKRAEMVRD